MTKPAEVFACLYAREFPAQALLRLRPELHERPCVVMEGEPPFEAVCSLNTKARLLGGFWSVLDLIPNIAIALRPIAR